MTNQHDIVYILKDGVEPEEIRYSLRSVCENFTYRKVWFYCGKPDGIEPDEWVQFEQVGNNKWERSTSTLQAICNNGEITSEFYLFNDDFYILKPYEQDLAIVDGTILEHANRVIKRTRLISHYVQNLCKQAWYLEKNGYGILNYATHTPLLVNRKSALEVIDTVPQFPPGLLFRNVYGNMVEAPYVMHDDVKTLLDDMESVPDEDASLWSSADRNFREGKTGEWIRARFPDPCRYEVA